MSEVMNGTLSIRPLLDKEVRAHVRVDDTGCAVVSTAIGTRVNSIVFTNEEIDSLILALQLARRSPLTTFAVDWGGDRQE